MRNGKKRIDVVSDDTDILVLLVYFCCKWQNRELIVSTRKKDGKVISINHVVQNLGRVCEELNPMYIINGTERTSYPYGKGKVSALSLLTTFDSFGLRIFGDLEATEDDINKAEPSFSVICLVINLKQQ